MSDSPLVRVLLDVDGVLNAVPGKTDDWTDWREGKAHNFRINWSPTVAKFIRGLAETPGVEVSWLTTWADLANQHICPLLDLPECIVAGAPPFREHRWWKFDIAQELWEATQIPFVWIDDDLGGFYDDGAAEWIGTLNGHGLGIRPDHTKGLTQRLLSEIEVFVDGWLESEKDDVPLGADSADFLRLL